jgi:hypothetical protein
MRIRCLFGALLLALVPACSLMGGGGDEAWTERSLTKAPPRRELLSYCQRALAQAGYPAPTVDEAASQAKSEWRNELQPFGGNGRRYRGTLQVEVLEGGVTQLRARVEAQNNKELARPLDPVQADWVDLPDDEPRARVLLQHLLALLAASGVSEGGR